MSTLFTAHLFPIVTWSLERRLPPAFDAFVLCALASLPRTPLLFQRAGVHILQSPWVPSTITLAHPFRTCPVNMSRIPERPLRTMNRPSTPPRLDNLYPVYRCTRLAMPPTVDSTKQNSKISIQYSLSLHTTTSADGG
ncbi:hypothetical protein E4T56_gene14743 [Termitomyces sp. T112]|nr:hypothetical protein E4T56_gene14743 [Termitomyces sp. T112]